jgi:uncharacterized damage-inducible protein DinB
VPASKKAKSAEPFVLSDALLRAFDTNDRINQFLISEGVTDAAWSAEPPAGKGRTIRAIASHMHNVRGMWLKATQAATLVDKLDRDRCTRAQAMKALDASRAALHEVVQQSLSGAQPGKIRGFKPDVAGFFAYLIAHDAHHRGQICMLARQAGHPIPQKVMFGMWEWGSR